VFNFPKAVLNPLISETAIKIDDAGKRQSIADRTEGLLSLKDETRTKYSKIASGQMAKAAIAIVAGPALLVIGAVIAPAATPILASITFLGAIGYGYKKLFQRDGRPKSRLKKKKQTRH
jgi:hypothetical protein